MLNFIHIAHIIVLSIGVVNVESIFHVPISFSWQKSSRNIAGKDSFQRLWIEKTLKHCKTMFSSPKRRLSRRTKKITMKKFLWLHFTLMLIVLVMFSLPLLSTALPHAIRIGAIFTGKTDQAHYAKLTI